MSYQPLVYAQTSNCIHISNNPTGCCTTEFDTTYPIGLQGLVSTEEWYHHIAEINHILKHNQKRMRIAIAYIFLVGCAFAITMASAAPTGDHSAVRVAPWFFIAGIILGMVWLVTLGKRLESNIRSILESYNREFVPRGVQWKLHVHQHHKKRTYMIEIDVNRTTAYPPAPVYNAPYPPTYANQPPANNNGQTYLQPAYPPYAPQTNYPQQQPNYTNNV